MKGNSVPTACETDFDGEVEDYTIIVEECRPNTEVTATTFSLSVEEPNAVYQWIDCNTGAAIEGAVDQVFIPSQNGSYAVFVDANGCKDTSDCFVMQSVGIVNQIFANQVKIYPNPTQGKFTIDMGEIYEKVNVEVSDLRGKRVFTQVVSNERLVNVPLDQPAGVYLLKVEVNGKRGVFKIVKE